MKTNTLKYTKTILNTNCLRLVLWKDGKKKAGKQYKHWKN